MNLNTRDITDFFVRISADRFVEEAARLGITGLNVRHETDGSVSVILQDSHVRREFGVSGSSPEGWAEHAIHEMGGRLT